TAGATTAAAAARPREARARRRVRPGARSGDRPAAPALEAPTRSVLRRPPARRRRTDRSWPRTTERRNRSRARSGSRADPRTSRGPSPCASPRERCSHQRLPARGPVPPAADWPLPAQSTINSGTLRGFPNPPATTRWAQPSFVNAVAPQPGRHPSLAELAFQLGQGVVDGAVAGHLVELPLCGDPLARPAGQLVIQTRLDLRGVDPARHPVELVEGGGLGSHRPLLIGPRLGLERPLPQLDVGKPRLERLEGRGQLIAVDSLLLQGLLGIVALRLLLGLADQRLLGQAVVAGPDGHLGLLLPVGDLPLHRLQPPFEQALIGDAARDLGPRLARVVLHVADHLIDLLTRVLHGADDVVDVGLDERGEPAEDAHDVPKITVVATGCRPRREARRRG